MLKKTSHKWTRRFWIASLTCVLVILTLGTIFNAITTVLFSSIEKEVKEFWGDLYDESAAKESFSIQNGKVAFLLSGGPTIDTHTTEPPMCEHILEHPHSIPVRPHPSMPNIMQAMCYDGIIETFEISSPSSILLHGIDQ